MAVIAAPAIVPIVCWFPRPTSSPIPMTSARSEAAKSPIPMTSTRTFAVLLETMYRLPSSESVTKVVIDESVILGDSEPMLMYENVDPPKAISEE